MKRTSLDHLIQHLEKIKSSDNYLLSPLLPETVIDSHKYSIIPDIFDRLIVTESILKGTPVLTCDRIIQKSGLIQTIWE